MHAQFLWYNRSTYNVLYLTSCRKRTMLVMMMVMIVKLHGKQENLTIGVFIDYICNGITSLWPLKRNHVWLIRGEKNFTSYLVFLNNIGCKAVLCFAAWVKAGTRLSSNACNRTARMSFPFPCISPAESDSKELKTADIASKKVPVTSSTTNLFPFQQHVQQTLLARVCYYSMWVRGLFHELPAKENYINTRMLPSCLG